MKIALIGRDAHRVLAFRGSLIRLAQCNGHEVIAITGPAAGDSIGALAHADVRWFGSPLDGGGMNPLADLAYRRTLERILREQRVDAVLAYNPKCLAHAPIAARRAGVGRVVGMVTGLGHGFIGNGWKERLVRLIKIRLYQRAFAACDHVLVQNEADLQELKMCGALPSPVDARVSLIAGSGVDLDHFTPVPLPEGAHFLMIARPLREKGLPEFFEAARHVKAQVPSATFTWLGPMSDPNPSAIDRTTLERWLAPGIVRHRPECADVRPAIAACSVFVLPSHREGTSKVMLEAMAMGRGVVTTDAPGCGGVLRDADCARVVPTRDSTSLAETLLKCAHDPLWRSSAAIASQRTCVARFDARMVDQTILNLLTTGTSGTLKP